MTDVAYIQQKLALETVHNQTKSENMKKFRWIINELQYKKGCARIAYIETTSADHFFASSSIVILGDDDKVQFWFGLSAEGIWINQYKYQEKIGCFHYHKIYSVESNVLIKALKGIQDKNFSFGFLLGDNCKVFALHFLKSCNLIDESKILMNSGRCRPGTMQTLAKLDKALVVNNTLISFDKANKQDLKTILEKYIIYREKKSVRLSLFGGYTRAEKVDVAKKLLQLDKNSIELTPHDYRVMTQGRLGLFIKRCEDSKLLNIECIKKEGEIKYQVSCRS